VVFENLSTAFPKNSQKELKVIEKSYYKHLCDIVFETIKSISLNENGIQKRFLVKNIAL